MKQYNLGNIDDIPSTGEPLGPELIAQLEKLGTPISEMGLLDFKCNNGNTFLVDSSELSINTSVGINKTLE